MIIASTAQPTWLDSALSKFYVSATKNDSLNNRKFKSSILYNL